MFRTWDKAFFFKLESKVWLSSSITLLIQAKTFCCGFIHPHVQMSSGSSSWCWANSRQAATFSLGGWLIYKSRFEALLCRHFSSFVKFFLSNLTPEIVQNWILMSELNHNNTLFKGTSATTTVHLHSSLPVLLFKSSLVCSSSIRH